MRSKGKIASWNDDKGYGFITPLTGGKQDLHSRQRLRESQPAT